MTLSMGTRGSAHESGPGTVTRLPRTDISVRWSSDYVLAGSGRSKPALETEVHILGIEGAANQISPAPEPGFSALTRNRVSFEHLPCLGSARPVYSNTRWTRASCLSASFLPCSTSRGAARAALESHWSTDQ